MRRHKFGRSLYNIVTLMLFIQFATTAKQVDVCTEDEYSCDEGKQCIPLQHKCNGFYGCVDSSDELNCESCTSNAFHCNHTKTCLPLSRKCNGINDCPPEGIEENYCDSCSHNGFLCKGTKRCIISSKRCNGELNCGYRDTSDEDNCESCLPNQFQCKHTRECVHDRQRCNGYWDCSDGDKSDEENCGTCSPYSFQCKITRECIPSASRCNGINDCGQIDKSDEVNCELCPEKSFKCLKPFPRCIPEIYKCDGYPHCEGSSDEKDYSCSNSSIICKATNQCIPYTESIYGYKYCPDDNKPLLKALASIWVDAFQCTTTKLYLHHKLLRCDGFHDCGINDTSDEENCDSCNSWGIDTPVHNLFYCSKARKCLPLFRKCDGVYDCGLNDYTDEDDCGYDYTLYTKIGSFSVASNETNITYILQNSNGNKIEFDSSKYELLVTKLENEPNTFYVELEIKNATVEDNGNFTLQIMVTDYSRKIKVLNFFFTVIVRNVLQIFPEFIYTNLQNSTIIFTPVTTLNLTCIVANNTGTGRRPIEINWKWENLLMKDWHPALNYSFDQNFQILSLKEVPIEKPGRFTCTALNSLGSISAYTDILIEPTNVILFEILGPILGTFGLLFLSFGLLCWYKYKQKQLRRKFFGLTHMEFYKGRIENLNPSVSLKDQANLLPFDKEKWEISRENIKLEVPLGSGAFGLVLKAEMLETEKSHDEDCTTVAVKTVKTCADESQFKALIMELKVMANLGKHLNIVNLIGACTDEFSKTRELLIVMEFCKYGSLLSYLIDNRNSFVNQLDPEADDIDSKICGARNEKNQTLVDKLGNQSSEPTQDSEDPPLDYYKGDYQLQEVKSITTTDLLSWAFQIAKGMEYLSTIKILHGDLAARNVLLADNKVAKICDFGYARETFQNYDYQKDTQGQLLPIKWMAIESLYQGIFSSKSDCWSYGILLWELFTLGIKPYPGIQAGEEFCQRLSEGYRMEKPINAPTSVYQIMMECWNKEPNERPTFSQISSDLLKIMPEDDKNRLVKMIDVYTNLNEVDKNADYLLRMGEPTLHAVRRGHFESMNVVAPLSEQVGSSHYGPEPTCSISENNSKDKFATFCSATPNDINI